MKFVENIDSQTINKLKGVAICIITFFHVKAFNTDLYFLCKEYALPLFFFLSGYLYFKYSRKKHTDYSLFIKGKAKRLLIPYLFMGGGYSLMKIIFFISSGDTDYISHIKGVVNIFINPIHSYAVFIWFAYVLFAIFAIIHTIKDKHIVYVFVLSIVLYIFKEHMTGYFGIIQISKYLIYFIFPYFLLKNYPQNTLQIFNISLVYPFIWAIMTFVSIKLIKYKVFNFFNLLGKESDAIYYIHPFIIAILSVFLPNVLIYNIIIGIAAIGIPVLMYYVIERYKLTIVGRLLYGKN